MRKKTIGKYKTWHSISFATQWLSVNITPQLGGRIIQLSLGDHEFFFVNESAPGKKSRSDRESGRTDWENFGGEKVWPAPQGWDSPDQWPGPPDPILDGGVYTAGDIEEVEDGLQVTLTSPFDKYTGLCIQRTVTIVETYAEAKVKATFINKSELPIRWSIWPVCQLKASEDGIGNRYQVICPVNVQSRFEMGYKVLHGLVNNPQNSIDADGKLVVNYQYVVGKVGLDSDSGWVAYLDSEYGKVLVMAFPYYKDTSYPDGTSVQIWTQGRGIIFSRHKIVDYPSDGKRNPPYIEIELLSPLQTVYPGESISFEYRILTCTIPAGEKIFSVGLFGILSSPLRIDANDDGGYITGIFGFFRSGVVRLNAYFPETAVADGVAIEVYRVSPLEALTIRCRIETKDLYERGCIRVTADLYDENNCFIGELDRLLL